MTGADPGTDRAAAAPRRLLFLPGAGGDPQFWAPVAQRLHGSAEQRHVGWPGHADVPADPSIRRVADLADRLNDALDVPTAIVAQSMGGVVALMLALRRPEQVTHLVLVATSGGIEVADLRPADWRADFVAKSPSLPRWFVDDRTDLTEQVPTISCPCLLLWGDADPISPVAIGERLAGLLRDSRMAVLAGGGHDLARTQADEVARRIDDFLGSKT